MGTLLQISNLKTYQSYLDFFVYISVSKSLIVSYSFPFGVSYTVHSESSNEVEDDDEEHTRRSFVSINRFQNI